MGGRRSAVGGRGSAVGGRGLAVGSRGSAVTGMFILNPSIHLYFQEYKDDLHVLLM